MPRGWTARPEKGERAGRKAWSGAQDPSQVPPGWWESRGRQQGGAPRQAGIAGVGQAAKNKT